jgi:beta-hydroxylase
MNTIIFIIIILIVIILVVFILTSEFNRLQGEEVLNKREYYLSGRGFLAPYTVWCSLNSRGTNIPFPDMELNFPNHNILKDYWKEIRDEAMNIYNTGKAGKIKDDMFFKGIADNGWKKFYIKWYGPITKEALELCPITTKIIQQLPEVKLAMFSILEPGSKITPHAGPFKGCIRYHLGLNSPKEAFIMVDGIKYNWKNGEDVLFDDTFIHEVKNESNELRIILFCDIERKMRDKFSQSVNKLVIDYLAPITSRANDRQEKQEKTS